MGSTNKGAKLAGFSLGVSNPGSCLTFNLNDSHCGHRSCNPVSQVHHGADATSLAPQAYSHHLCGLSCSCTIVSSYEPSYMHYFLNHSMDGLIVSELSRPQQLCAFGLSSRHVLCDLPWLYGAARLTDAKRITSVCAVSA